MCAIEGDGTLDSYRIADAGKQRCLLMDGDAK